MGFGTFAKGDTEFLGRAAAIDGKGRPGQSAAAREYLTGFRVGSQALIINGVAVVLGDQLASIGIDFDQEIACRIKGDEPLGKPLIELGSGRVIAHGSGTFIPRGISG